MNLELSEEQQLLKDMVNRFAADAGGLEAHRAAIRSDLGWSRTVWGQMAELGLLALPVPEAAGGLGGGGIELMTIGEAFGRHLLTEPFLDSALTAGVFLADSGALEGAIGGTGLFALAQGEVRATDNRLTGDARMVANGGTADGLIVATVEGLYLVAGDAEGVSRSDYPIHGGGRAADIRFDRALGRLLAGDGQAAALLNRWADCRVVFLAAEALGACGGAFETTLDYLKTRIQFGTTIGSNQALQHRAAEMFVEIEQLRSAAILAACSLDDPDLRERARVMAAVAAIAAKTARFIAQQAVQLHGGVGVTEEHPVGHWFLRLTAIGILLGGVDANIATLAGMGGLVPARPYWDVA